MVRKLIGVSLAIAVAALLGGLAWRSRLSADAGELLVLRDRVVEGPARRWVAPWTERTVAPPGFDIELRLEPQSGQHPTPPPVDVRAVIDLVPSDVSAAARNVLLADDGWIDEPVQRWCRQALVKIAEDAGPFADELFGRPAALSGALSRGLESRLPEGFRVTFLEAVAENAGEPAPTGGTGRPRVLYIGLDGADWEVIDRLLGRGELPTFRALLRQGARADIVAYEPMMSPLLWTTAITGRPPVDHGIFDFTLAGPDGRKLPITSQYRKTPALWEILSAWGQPSAFVDFWASHPAEQIDGVLVSDVAETLLRDPDRDTARQAGAVWPPDALDGIEGAWTTDDAPIEAVRRYAPSITERELDEARAYWRHAQQREAWQTGHPQGPGQPPVAFLLHLAVGTHNLEQITLELLDRQDLGVVGVYFGDIDQAGHNFQHLAPPPHPLAEAAERRRFGEVVENCYRAQDATLGRLVRRAGPETVVLIHSDHGFRWGNRRPRDLLPFARGRPVEWHRLQGVFLAAGGPVRRGIRVSDLTLYDVAPTLLALRGVPPAENMPGRIRADLFQPDTAALLSDTRVASWDSLVAPRRYAVADAAAMDESRQELVDRLRALGYVGGDAAPDVPAAGTAELPEGEERPQVTYYRNKATWLMNQDLYDEAEQALLEANRLQPLPKTYSLISEARAARHDLDGAVAALEEGFRQLPDKMPAAALLWLVELHIERGDLSAARRALTNIAVPADPHAAESAPVIAAGGRVAEAAGDSAAAEAAYVRALEADPREVRAAQRLAALANTASDKARLETFVRRGLELDPRIEIYWEMLGLLRLESGDPAGAADAFREAGDLNPDNDGIRVNEAAAAARAGQSDRARGIYEALVAQGSRRPAVWVNLGNLSARRGDWRDALEKWQHAVDLGADAPQLHAAIRDAQRRLGSR